MRAGCRRAQPHCGHRPRQARREAVHRRFPGARRAPAVAAAPAALSQARRPGRRARPSRCARQSLAAPDDDAAPHAALSAAVLAALRRERDLHRRLCGRFRRFVGVCWSRPSSASCSKRVRGGAARGRRCRRQRAHSSCPPPPGRCSSALTPGFEQLLRLARTASRRCSGSASLVLLVFSSRTSSTTCRRYLDRRGWSSARCTTCGATFTSTSPICRSATFVRHRLELHLAAGERRRAHARRPRRRRGELVAQHAHDPVRPDDHRGTVVEAGAGRGPGAAAECAADRQARHALAPHQHVARRSAWPT